MNEESIQKKEKKKNQDDDNTMFHITLSDIFSLHMGRFCSIQIS